MTTDEDGKAQLDPDIHEQLTNDNKGETLRPIIKIDPNNIPTELHDLIPLAEKWGIPDRKLEETLLQEAPLSEIEALYQIVYLQDADIARYIRSPLSSEHSTGDEVEVFSALYELYFGAGSILQQKLPKRWLEIIGWPESCPNPELYMNQFPSELKPLIPFANKWANDEESVREPLIRLASTIELQEFTSVVKQIGIERIESRAAKMVYDEKREEGLHILMLMELLDFAESELNNRASTNPDIDIALGI